jgi:sugar transferase (PEP-CTERM/EpsH1 system associated)
MNSRRPRILLLVHRVPYPPNRGDRIRSFHLLQFLAERSQLDLAFLAERTVPAETLRVLQQKCHRVAGVTLGRWTRWLRAAWSLAIGRTATEGLFASSGLRRVLREWAGQERFDAVVVFCSSMAQYLNVRGLKDVPAIVDLVDVDSQKWFDYAGTACGLRRLVFRLEGRRLRRLEQSIARRVKAITLVSEPEADLCRSFCESSFIRAVPNGVDLDYFHPVEADEAAIAQRCVFVGALDYRANIDGVRWFCERVWPEVRRRLPGATLALVGSNPSPSLRPLAEVSGVELVGEVPDVRPHLAGAAVCVVPLRVARGIQNKVLEALGMGKAVVATPQALEGLGVEAGVHVLRAATPAEWIEATTALLADAGRRGRLGLAGRQYVETHHRWALQLVPFGELLGLADSPAGQVAGSTSTSDLGPPFAQSHA